jgi:drug/metabolite transporter (DMT)-like permease
LAAIVVGITLMYRGHVSLSGRSLWLLTLPVAASAICGVIQPIVKFGFEWRPNPIAAAVVSYTVSSAVLILSALARAEGGIPTIDARGVLWFAAVGLCNGLSVLAMYSALEYGPIATISPLIASYPLVTLVLSRAFLRKEDLRPQLIGGVTATICGRIAIRIA